MKALLLIKSLLLFNHNNNFPVYSETTFLPPLLQQHQQQCIKEQSTIEWTNYNNNDNNNANANAASSIYKEEYEIGVLAIRGFEAAYAEFNTTFSDYLTQTAGKKFNPPIKFKMKPLNFILLFDDTANQNVDFFYVNPSAYSCIESEYGAQSLASQISRRKVSGNTYHLTQFGGVIFTLANNTKINSVKDIKGHSTAAASVSGLGSGQMQARELIKNGLSYMNDPSQVVYTSNQGKVVNGVLNGEFDVGFVRTDQIERSADSNGNPINTSLFKTIEPKEGLNIDGTPFPFQSSTPLYPEWNIAALTTVPDDISLAVQDAMYKLEEYAIVGEIIDNCYNTKNCSNNVFTSMQEQCKASCLHDDPKVLDNLEQCTLNNNNDTTSSSNEIDIALLAHRARSEGKYTGWRSTLSYMELRNMQEETNFIKQNIQTGAMQCVRSKNIYDAITCPEGHFKKSEEDVLNGCSIAGLRCKDGYQCLCKPCVKAFDVNIYPELVTEPCGKFTVCGELQQLKSLSFVAIDNKQRNNVTISILLHEEDKPYQIIASKTQNYTYSYTISAMRVGTIIMEVFVDNGQIPESPFRIQVNSRDCATDYNDVLRVPNENGDCVCSSNSIQSVSGKCISYKILLPSIMIPLCIIMIICTYFYIQRKRAQADSIWAVKVEELNFREPPIIVGRGTFGLVLLAEYRGTLVAVKRVIPPKFNPATVRRFSVNNIMDSAGSIVRSVRDVIGASINGGDYSSSRRGGSLDNGNSVILTNIDILAADEDCGDHDDPNNNDNNNNTEPAVVIKVDHNRRGSLSTIGSITSYPPKNDIIMNDDNNNSNKAIEHGQQNQMQQRKSSIINADSDDRVKKSRRRSSLTYWNDVENDMEAGNIDAPIVPSTVKTETGMKSGAFHGLSSMRIGLKSNGTSAANGPGLTSNTASSSGFLSKNSSGFNSLLSSGGSFGVNTLDRLKPSFLKEDEYTRLKSEFITEMRHLSKLRHPCITTVMGAVIDKKEEPMLVMEYMELGSLYDLLHNETMILDGEFLLPVLKDIAQGVRFLHTAVPQVIHGDLKAQNVLVDHKFRAKVADFGLSQKRKVGATGTPYWMAPELLRGESENTSASDVFSFGIILYEVYSRKDPYEGENYKEVLKLIADQVVSKRPPVPPSCPQLVASIMKECLVDEASKRPSFEELDQRLKRLDPSTVEPGKMIMSLQRQKAERESMNAGNARLYESFPKHVADSIIAGRKVEPESFPVVTIFFSDIVGFTTISSTLSPKKVSEMLDRLYLKFDELSDKHEIFKIETIGDAYMCVTNLMKPQPDHAKRIALFSMDAIEAAASTPVDLEDETMGTINIRVGFHSGPVVASAVGSRNLKYSIFGDTVNTASRMESNSKPGRIQCSDASAIYVKKQYPELLLKKRRPIQVKGKGIMQTFWVNESRNNDIDDIHSIPVSTGLTNPQDTLVQGLGTGA